MAIEFKNKVLVAAKWKLDRLTREVPFPVELLDLSIDIERLEQIDANFISKLDACCIDDVEVGEDFYIEAILMINDRNVISSNVVKIESPFKIVIDFSKIEIFYISEDEKEKYKKFIPPIIKPLEVLNGAFVTKAILFGLQWALGKL